MLSGRLPTSSAARPTAEDVHPGRPRSAAPAAHSAHAAPKPAPQPAKAAAEELLEDALRLILAELVPPGAPRRKACSCSAPLTHEVCICITSHVKIGLQPCIAPGHARYVSWTAPCMQPAAAAARPWTCCCLCTISSDPGDAR